MSKKLHNNFFTFQGILSRKDFWKNFLEKLLILIFFNVLLTFLVSFEASIGDYGVYFRNDYIGTILGITFCFFLLFFNILTCYL